jgi:ferredoxin
VRPPAKGCGHCQASVTSGSARLSPRAAARRAALRSSRGRPRQGLPSCCPRP